MPETIKTIQAVVTLIAAGILFGLGWALAQRAINWPLDRIAGGAALACLLIVVIAWLV